MSRTTHAPIRRINAALPAASMLIAILALLLAAGGVGYAAGLIGTSDIRNHAVTTAKVRNGTLKAADLVRERRFAYVGSPGAPSFSTGGQGDCLWQAGSALLPGLSDVGFRKDRFGTVHLVGIALPADDGGGDGTCDAATEVEDAIAFVLPAAYRPARTTIRGHGAAGVIVVGRNALVAPSFSLPAGAVAVAGPADTPLALDGISYQPAGSTVVSGQSAERVTPDGRQLLRQLGLG